MFRTAQGMREICMNIAISKDIRTAYEHSEEVLANIKVGRDSLVDMNVALTYIQIKHYLRFVVYSCFFAEIGFLENSCDMRCDGMA